MAAVDITSSQISQVGTNLTDMALTTMVTGAGNGVKFAYDERGVVVFNNNTAGAATITLKVQQPSSASDLGLTLSDKTITLAAGKMLALKMAIICKDTASKVTVECDTAIGVKVLTV